MERGHGAKIDRMSLKSTFEWGGVAELVEKRKAALATELQAYWNETAPDGERFDADKATALLLRNVRRYEAALRRVAEKAEEQKALMEHREKTGQEVPASDLQRYFAYLKTAHIAAEALDRPELVTSLNDLERGPEAGNTGGGLPDSERR